MPPGCHMDVTWMPPGCHLDAGAQHHPQPLQASGAPRRCVSAGRRGLRRGSGGGRKRVKGGGLRGPCHQGDDLYTRSLESHMCLAPVKNWRDN
eukprot:1175997-Prorocentrum_minimum.AAC.9